MAQVCGSPRGSQASDCGPTSNVRSPIRRDAAELFTTARASFAAHDAHELKIGRPASAVRHPTC